jgi:hypothetical protein
VYRGQCRRFVRAGPLSAQQIPNTPAPLSSNWRQYNNLLGSGISFWAINPKAMDDPLAFWKSLYPDATTQPAPGITWAVRLKETTGFLQTDFNGELGSMSYSGNVGVRVIHTERRVTQDLSGDPGQYARTGRDRQRGHRAQMTILPSANSRST